MRNVVIVRYRRVSTEDQKERGYSLPEQTRLCDEKIVEIKRELEATGEEIHLQVVDFEDTMGGDILNRPVLEEVREFVRTHRPDYFVCLDPDRFSRSLVQALLVKEEIEKAGTKLIFVQHNYDQSAEGKLFFSLRGAIAEFEKAKILERMKRGMRGKLRQGKLPHYVPVYGYTFDKESDSLVVNEEEAQWVRQIFQWFAEGIGPLEIRHRLNELGVPAKRGGPWYTSTIRSILKNTTYVGKMRCNRYDCEGLTALAQLPKQLRDKPLTTKKRPESEWIIVSVPPIIDQELFDAAQARFRTLKRRAKKGAGILSGLMVCGLCGGAVHYVAHKQHGHVLRCINRYPSSRETKEPVPKCQLPYVKASIIEDQVWAEVSRWILEPEATLEAMRKQSASSDQEARVAKLERDIDAIEAAIQSKRQEQATVIKNQTKGLLDETVAEELLRTAKEEIDRLTIQLKKKTQDLEALRYQMQSVDRFGERLASVSAMIAEGMERTKMALEATLPHERQQIIRFLVQEVRLLPGKSCSVLPIV